MDNIYILNTADTQSFEEASKDYSYSLYLGHSGEKSISPFGGASFNVSDAICFLVDEEFKIKLQISSILYARILTSIYLLYAPSNKDEYNLLTSAINDAFECFQKTEIVDIVQNDNREMLEKFLCVMKKTFEVEENSISLKMLGITEDLLRKVFVEDEILPDTSSLPHTIQSFHMQKVFDEISKANTPIVYKRLSSVELDDFASTVSNVQLTYGDFDLAHLMSSFCENSSYLIDLATYDFDNMTEKEKSEFRMLWVLIIRTNSSGVLPRKLLNNARKLLKMWLFSDRESSDELTKKYKQHNNG